VTTIIATAPVRVADIGGWTDTWFAGSGRVCSVAVSPGARVELRLGAVAGPITLEVGSTGDRYSFAAGSRPGRHPLLEAAIAALPPRVEATISVGAFVPPGSGLGTSAAVVVALLAALAAGSDIRLSADELAAMAHGVETGLGWQSGVQDQWAAAWGGVSDLTVEYPHVTRRALTIDPDVAAELGRRLITVYLGRPHSSSTIHDEVITRLATSDPGPAMRRLRDAAADGIGALAIGDLGRYGEAMTDHHEAVRSLHAGLISRSTEAVIALATGCGAQGWKANGAGGDGGSVTLLGPAYPLALDTLRRALGTMSGVEILDLVPTMHGATASVEESGVR
jgi:D-glycero-alpha-D-manno-heptose-7-phosphate kinase